MAKDIPGADERNQLEYGGNVTGFIETSEAIEDVQRSGGILRKSGDFLKSEKYG